MSNLLKEAFKFKKYKAMPTALAVFTGILMIPFVVASFFVTAIFAVLSFAFAVFTSPVKFLHGVANNEGKDVKHATQFIIYFISWPLIFLCYAMMSLMLLIIAPTYAILSILPYIWSFGGFKFHLFMTDNDDISITVEKKYLGIPLGFIIVGFMFILLIPFFHWLFGFVSCAYDSWRKAFLFSGYFFGIMYPIYVGIHCFFALVYSLIASPYPKGKKALTAEADASASNTDIE